MTRIVGGLLAVCIGLVAAPTGSAQAPAVKPLPDEYRVLAAHIGQSLKSSGKDFRSGQSLADSAAECHNAIFDLKAVKSQDTDITYIAGQAVAALTDSVARLERLNALPKPQGSGEVFVESFIHGLYGNVFAGYAVGVEADNRRKALLDEVTGLGAAADKADAAHLLLPRVAERYAAASTQPGSRFSVKYLAAWNVWGPYDWCELYNGGGDLEDCTVVVELKNAGGKSRKNVHFARKWPGRSSLVARYDPGTLVGERRLGCMTVSDVATVDVRVLSPALTTSVKYTYAGGERAKG